MNRKVFFEEMSKLNFTKKQLLKIQIAYSLAKNFHRLQMRDGGERYFNHLTGVVFVLLEFGIYKWRAIIVALCHDLLEDTYIPPQLLHIIFGWKVTKAVSALSKKRRVFHPASGHVTKTVIDTTDTYYAHLTKAAKITRLVKCADRIYNLRDLDGWSHDEKVSKAQETENYVIPLATLTHSGMKEELERLVKEIFSSEK